MNTIVMHISLRSYILIKDSIPTVKSCTSNSISKSNLLILHSETEIIYQWDARCIGAYYYYNGTTKNFEAICFTIFP